MSQCYAHHLGDCNGTLEDEHFFSRALQRMLGPVDLAGLPWLRGSVKKLPPGSYLHSSLLCRKHHDDLDGIDRVALAYFQNLMLILGGGHIGKGTPGSIDQVVGVIDGRRLEKWFLKLICGVVASGSFEIDSAVQTRWVEALFGRVGWPEEWALYITQGTRTLEKADASMHLEFHWTATGGLNGLIATAFAIEHLFALMPPDVLSPLAMRHPRRVGFRITRPGNADILKGAPHGTDVSFEIQWPEHHTRATSTRPMWPL